MLRNVCVFIASDICFAPFFRFFPAVNFGVRFSYAPLAVSIPSILFILSPFRASRF
jgi:hypothetical protein